MTIHDTHPFADPDPDPVRRLRGRLGGAVALLTAGAGPERAGLTVTSLLLAHGEPPHLVVALDPDADLTELLLETGAASLQLLGWAHRDLAGAFAGTAPAPGGPFRTGSFDDGPWGPRLLDATAWAGVRLVDQRPLGWSTLVTCAVEDVEVGDDPPSGALGHRRGRWLRLGSGHDGGGRD
jgi:flavin reductase (DIM6/NTAB) family NADH-FMN oxidoreductase RutF